MIGFFSLAMKRLVKQTDILEPILQPQVWRKLCCPNSKKFILMTNNIIVYRTFKQGVSGGKRCLWDLKNPMARWCHLAAVSRYRAIWCQLCPGWCWAVQGAWNWCPWRVVKWLEGGTVVLHRWVLTKLLKTRKDYRYYRRQSHSDDVECPAYGKK